MAETFNIFLIVMAVLAAGVYVAPALFRSRVRLSVQPEIRPPVPNKVGWVVMESPVFIAMCVLWLMSGRTWEAGPLALFVLFQAHYLQRAFIFPLLLRGESKMPLGIVVMGMAFNTLNALMQGGWIFYVSPEGYYADWFAKPYIYVGEPCSWRVGRKPPFRPYIRNLRKPGDTRHYIPLRGDVPDTSRRPTISANCSNGRASPVASWSWAGAVFAWWTFANLAPRAASLYKRYAQEFGKEFTALKRKKIIPFIY